MFIGSEKSYNNIETFVLFVLSCVEGLPELNTIVIYKKDLVFYW